MSILQTNQTPQNQNKPVVTGWNLSTRSNDGEDHVDIYLYGIVGDWLEGNESIDLVTALNQYSNLKTITVHINSPGGIIDEGLAMLSTLRKHPAEVTTEIDGIAASIASVVLLAASPGRVRMARSSYLMIHNASWGAWGTADELEKMSADLRKMEGVLIDEYVLKTGKTKEEIKAMVDAETYMTADEALEMGFIDEIIEPEGTLEQALNKLPENVWQSMRAANLKNMPKPVEALMAGKNKASNQAGATGASANTGGATPATTTQVPAQPVNTDTGSTSDAGNTATGQVGEKLRQEAIKLAFANFGGSAGQYASLLTACLQDFDCTAENAREKLLGEVERRNSIEQVFSTFGGIDGQYKELATACMQDASATADKARTMLLNKIGEQSPGPIAGDFNNMRITHDERDSRIDLAVNAMMFRGGKAKLEQGNPFAHMTLMDMAKACLNTAGQQHQGLTPLEIAGRSFNMQSSSDFPVILERLITEAVLIEYNAVPSTWREWCTVGQVSDFRDHDRLRIGSIGNLDDLGEGGEYKNKSIPDGEKEKLRAKTKGNIIAITREAIINDDLGYFMNMSRWLGNAAARTIEALAYSTLLSNPKLSDGKALFHAGHNNLASGDGAGDIHEKTLDGMAVRMGEQKDISGNDELAIDPAILLVPRAKKMLANKWMNSANQPIAGDAGRPEPNGVMGLAKTVASPRIKTGYYLLASPSAAPVIEMLFLNGIEEPFIDTQDGWRTDGAEMKVRLDVGCGAVDFRGAQFNPGA